MNPSGSQHKRKSFLPLQGVDLPTILLYLLMVVIGWVTIYAAGYDPDFLGDSLVIEGRPKSQLIWIGISFAAALLVLLIEPRAIRRITLPLYGITLVVLVATIFLSPDIKGSHSWLVVTETVRIQPAEFAKVSTAMMLAWWCDRYGFQLSRPKHLMVAFGIFILPLLIIIMQSETGSALVFLSFVMVLYREGLTSAVPLSGVLLAAIFVLTLYFQGIVWGATEASHLIVFLLLYVVALLAMKGYTRTPRWTLQVGLTFLPIAMLLGVVIHLFTPIDFAIPALIALLGLLGFGIYCSIRFAEKKLTVISVVLALCAALQQGVEYFFNNILQPHQQIRILVSLGLKDDPSGAGYNVRQSLIAIGSGGVTGKGYLQGTQTKLSFVPEQDTDFIFCTLGEEFGFIGSLVLLVLFVVLLLRLIKIAERQESTYVRIYGYSVVCIIFFHLVINIGMVIGLVPVIGIPLPFISYGGSSLLSFTLLLFILLRLDRPRDT